MAFRPRQSPAYISLSIVFFVKHPSIPVASIKTRTCWPQKPPGWSDTRGHRCDISYLCSKAKSPPNWYTSRTSIRWTTEKIFNHMNFNINFNLCQLKCKNCEFPIYIMNFSNSKNRRGLPHSIGFTKYLNRWNALSWIY